MGRQVIVQRLQFYTTFETFLTTLYCLILFQYIGYTLETSENINGDTFCEKCCSNEGSTTTPINETNAANSCSFAEKFIKRKAGRFVDLKKLVTKYSSICPVQDFCGVHINQPSVNPDALHPDVTGCSRCWCDVSCSTFGNCCPGSHFGYADYTCVNTVLYPKDAEISYYMVGSCQKIYTDNKTVVELCSEEIVPCTGAESQLAYKNKHCAECNHESECIQWDILIKCKEPDQFEEQMQSFTSHLEMKDALDENKCLIVFQPNLPIGLICHDANYDYLNKIRIDKCNVSGLWEEFDADIEWACANFIIPFKQFKNIFCYICNPSHVQEQIGLIDSCSTPTSDNVSEACSTMPKSDRFAPFKNVYCYICNQGYDSLYKSIKPSLKYIEEENDVNLTSRLDIALQFNGDHPAKHFKEFLSDFIIDQFDVINQDMTISETIQSDYIATNFDEFEKIYTSICGTGTLCYQTSERNTTDKTYSNPVCKKCDCGSRCLESESCCPDILLTRKPYSCQFQRRFPIFYQKAMEETEWKEIFETKNAIKDFRYKTINTCVNDDVPENTKEKCIANNDKTDVFTLIPVSTDTGITYNNMYCYVCNNNKTNITLKLQTVCNAYIEHKLFANLDHLLKVIKRYCKKISFVPVKNKLCNYSYDPLKAAVRDGEKFVRRELHPSLFEFKSRLEIKVKAAQYQKPVRNVFEICNRTGHYRKSELGNITNSICESVDVNLMSLPEYRVDNNVYKNFACFLCNPENVVDEEYWNGSTSTCLSKNSTDWYEPNVILDELCNKTESHSRWFPFKNMYCAECNLPPWQLIDVNVTPKDLAPAASYKYIFSLSMDDFKHLDEAVETETIPDCGRGTYDYHWKQCRSLNCFPGFQLMNSTCTPVLESVVRHEYEMSFYIHYKADDSMSMNDTRNTNRTLLFDFVTLSSAIVNDILLSFDETTEYMLRKIRHGATPCESHPFGHAHHLNYVDLLEIDVFKIQFLVRIVKTQHASMIQRILLQALNRKFNITDVLNIQGKPQTIQLFSTEANIKRGVESGGPLLESGGSLLESGGPLLESGGPLLESGGPLWCEQFGHFVNRKYESLIFKHISIDSFLTCGHVVLNSYDVWQDIKADNIIIKNTNATFSSHEYKIIDNDIIICGDLYSERTFIEPNEIIVIRTDAIKSILMVFSIVCTIVSILCLLLTFVTYCLISSLRTVAGKNIMALCVSLFFSQALLQFGINAKSIHTMCVAIGVLIHLSWLMSFCAMNICSFHTFKVFYYNSKNNIHSNEHSRSKLFLKYIFYIICLPVFVVAATISINLIRSESTKLGYGQFYCFISDFYIFMSTFITPACLIFLSNIVFFSLAFHEIRCTPKTHGTRDRNHFFICLRLFTIVGIAWPLLIIDNFFGITWFSFIVAGVNSLQGVFIFVSFVLNRRVATELLSILKKYTEQTSLETNST